MRVSIIKESSLIRESLIDNLTGTFPTVKNRVSSILNKLSVPDRTTAVLKAIKNRWFVV
ncbi:helix-turn-helix domain-containing protein [Salinibacillus xinjiangensis]|uniref:hypothetical protein n=1 Tax=Salinibacillus xinjiangensis TaxID=1229268 RepID=UPI00389A0A2D